MRRALCHGQQIDPGQSLVNRQPDLWLGETQVFRSECHIFFNGGPNDLVVRILEYHAALAPDFPDALIVPGIVARDNDSALGWKFERIDQAGQGRFA